jgi:hypothetical protein
MRSLLLALLIAAQTAVAHEAPSGWSYDTACCSGMDCRPVEPGEVSATPRGYEIAPTGEIVPFNSTKVRPSGDGAMHRCMVGGETTIPTICIYVPGGV